jgi:hypothetical protein
LADDEPEDMDVDTEEGGAAGGAGGASAGGAGGGPRQGKRKKRCPYSAEQLVSMKNALAAGNLKTPQQKKELAASISGHKGARAVTPDDLTTWVRNQRKK